MTTQELRLRAGDLVEVKTAAEILATLDEAGCLDGMPFMPEMLSFCGRTMRVAKVAHKTCDTKCYTGTRSISACVHLEDSRCDGSGHGGCQARCNLFWKEAWLRRAGAPRESAHTGAPAGRCSEASLARAAWRDEGGVRFYSCQATQILEASKLVAWWDPRQYIRDVTSGNASVSTVAKVLIMSWFNAWRRYGYPYRLSHWASRKVHTILFGGPTPNEWAPLTHPLSSASDAVGVQPGERVRIKPHAEIRSTLKNSRHRGLWFDVEMAGFCEQEFPVALRVEKIINEQTGEMMQMKSPCIMLEGVVCRGRYSENRLLCPRAIPPYWREIWLQRVADEKQADVRVPSKTAAKNR
jgi:hypothetical protein